MIIVMKKNASAEDIAMVHDRIVEMGYRPHMIEGVERTVIGAVGDENKEPLESMATIACVEAVHPILKPYKLVGRELNTDNTTIRFPNGVEVGGAELAMMAGPCSVENREQILASAHAIAATGTRFLRGGAFKPRTNPYAFQGLGVEGLELLAEARRQTGLLIVTELTNLKDLDAVVDVTDVIQIGARNVQNFPLLQAAGETQKPILFKRGMATTLKEYLQAAEYILDQNNYNVMLCERGIRTFETAYRNTLDLNAVPVLKQETHLPVIVDVAHGTGRTDIIPAMARAAVAAGADGIMVEVHPDPTKALSDGPQSLKPEMFQAMLDSLAPVAAAMGRPLAKI